MKRKKNYKDDEKHIRSAEIESELYTDSVRMVCVSMYDDACKTSQCAAIQNEKL